MLVLIAFAMAAPTAAQVPAAPLGTAVSRNIETQVGDMHPEYRGLPIEGGSGHLAAGAIQRYRTDRVKMPQQIITGGAAAAPLPAPAATQP